MARNNNWVKLNRSIWNNFLWTENEPFDRRSAWVDLILLANHEDGEFITRHGNTIKIPRGSHFTSIRTLAKRWHWSTSKVQRYLDTLTDTQMVTLTGTQTGTLVSIVKYDDFQGRRYTDEHSNEYTDEYTDDRRTRNKEGYKKKRSNRPATLQEKIEAMKRFAAEGDARERDEQRRSDEAL